MLRPLALAILLPLPALAQDGAARVVDLLVAACDAAPNASVTPVTTPNAMVGVSADGKVVISSSALPDDQAQMVSRFVNTATLPGGKMTSCSLTIVAPQEGAFDALPDTLAARAAAILGAEPVSAGGAVAAWGGEKGIARYWATPDFPPAASLSLTQGGPAITINLNRFQPGN